MSAWKVPVMWTLRNVLTQSEVTTAYVCKDIRRIEMKGMKQYAQVSSISRAFVIHSARYYVL